VDKERYNQIKTAVTLGVGLIMIYEALRTSNYILGMVTVLVGMLTLYVARTRVDEVLYDERTRLIREKAASRTLGLMAVAMGAGGLMLIEASYRGFAEFRQTGYVLAYLASFTLWIYMLFSWYYRRQMGG
jgi:uncharacterized membrane protein